jgi:hypothetical protein
MITRISKMKLCVQYKPNMPAGVLFVFVVLILIAAPLLRLARNWWFNTTNMKLLNIVTVFSLIRATLIAADNSNSSSIYLRTPPSVRRQLPRLILYQQTHHDSANRPVSLLPLVDIPQVTHVYIAAFHINGPGWIHLNDHPPEHKRFDTLWKEMQVLKENGIKVMAMLGGAAVGSFRRLSTERMQSVRPFVG